MTEGNTKTVRADNWLPTLDENISLIITDEVINRRLVFIAQCVDDAYDFLEQADKDWAEKNKTHELAMAETRIELGTQKNSNDKPYTIPEKDDLSLIRNKDTYQELVIAAQVVRSAKANIDRLASQQSNVQTIAKNFNTAIKA